MNSENGREVVEFRRLRASHVEPNTAGAHRLSCDEFDKPRSIIDICCITFEGTLRMQSDPASGSLKIK